MGKNTMPRVAGFSAALLLFFVVETGCSDNGPELAIDRSTHVFPADHRGPTQTEFVLTNVGRRQLLIEDVVSSCGCVVAELPTRELASGESVSLNVQITRPTIGKVIASIAVLSNSKRNKLLDIEILAHAESDNPRIIRVEPRVLNIEVSSGENSPESRLTVKSIEPKTAEFITRIHSDLPFVTFKRISINERRSMDPAFVERAYTWVAEIADTHPKGRSSGTAVVYGEAASNTSKREIPIVFFSRRAVRTIPERLFGSITSTKRQQQWTVRLVQQDHEQRCRIIEAKADVDWLEVKSILGKDNSDSEQVLAIRTAKIPEEFPTRASVSVRFDTLSCDPLHIPVTLVDLRSDRKVLSSSEASER